MRLVLVLAAYNLILFVYGIVKLYRMHMYVGLHCLFTHFLHDHKFYFIGTYILSNIGCVVSCLFPSLLLMPPFVYRCSSPVWLLITM